MVSAKTVDSNVTWPRRVREQRERYSPAKGSNAIVHPPRWVMNLAGNATSLVFLNFDQFLGECLELTGRLDQSLFRRGAAADHAVECLRHHPNLPWPFHRHLLVEARRHPDRDALPGARPRRGGEAVLLDERLGDGGGVLLVHVILLVHRKHVLGAELGHHTDQDGVDVGAVRIRPD